ncbi:MAG: hypothetical protein KME40_26995 [Komarekiella atlantica HA4396-MV6]|nr:hypothetical protein [Komarekiella atlantica HA4396-MV6]
MRDLLFAHRVSFDVGLCQELSPILDVKGNEQWVWLALAVETREIVGCHIRDRCGASAKALWQSLPAVYRQCAVCYSGFWGSYPVALPSSIALQAE